MILDIFQNSRVHSIVHSSPFSSLVVRHLFCHVFSLSKLHTGQQSAIHLWLQPYPIIEHLIKLLRQCWPALPEKLTTKPHGKVHKCFLGPLMDDPREMMAKPALIKGFSQPSPDTATMFHPSGKPTGSTFFAHAELSPRILLEVKLMSWFCSHWWLKGLQNYSAFFKH